MTQPIESCIGVWGRIFGHDFKEFLISYVAIMNPQGIKLHGYGEEPIELAKAMANKTYKVRCKRCGKEAE